MSWGAPYRWSIARGQTLLDQDYVFATRMLAEKWVEHCFWCYCATDLRAVPVPFVQKEPA